MPYCENCGSFIEDFQDRCDGCGMERDVSYEQDEAQMFWLYPLMSWEDSPRYSAVNGRRLKDADMAFCLSSLVPGLGQAYDDRRRRGALVFSTFAVLLAMTILTFMGGWEWSTPVSQLLLVTTVAFWVVQLIDAVRMTDAANRSISAMPEVR